MSGWTADSNEALCLQLVRADVDSDALSAREKPVTHVFHPRFTYPIFGEQEKLYGYENLRVNLHFASGSLRQYLGIEYTAKLTDSTIDNPEKQLYDFVPPDYIKDPITFKQQVEKDAIAFKPMGRKIYSYSRRASARSDVERRGEVDTSVNEEDKDAAVFEVYHATWETPGFLEYHRRMQLFILLYIEAGSYLQEDEDQWEFVVLFERRKRKEGQYVYHFVGYSSLYPFYYYPDSTRMRLSQFVIIGPYQKQGHGAGLYRAIYDYVLKSPDISELTVEDPSEDFEDLRDRCDLRMLLCHQKFIKGAYADQKILSTEGARRKKPLTDTNAATTDRRETSQPVPKLGPPVKKAWAKKWKVELKLAQRQYDRLIEMMILRALDPKDEKSQRVFRLQVKSRLKVFNFETLAQLELDEQWEKLEETYENVKEGYVRILKMIS